MVLSADFSLFNILKGGWRGGWAVLVVHFREAGSGSQGHVPRGEPGLLGCGEVEAGGPLKPVFSLLEKKTESHILGEVLPQTNE